MKEVIDNLTEYLAFTALGNLGAARVLRKEALEAITNVFPTKRFQQVADDFAEAAKDILNQSDIDEIVDALTNRIWR